MISFVTELTFVGSEHIGNNKKHYAHLAIGNLRNFRLSKDSIVGLTRIALAAIVYPLTGFLRASYWDLTWLAHVPFYTDLFTESVETNLARWYNRVAESGFKSFNTIAATFHEHSDEIINFFDNQSTNASAESLNSKIKAFRAKLHGVIDSRFFIFRLYKIYA